MGNVGHFQRSCDCFICMLFIRDVFCCIYRYISARMHCSVKCIFDFEFIIDA